MITNKTIERLYTEARDRYAQIGVDTEATIERMEQIAISLHCWQGDDVGGFETSNAELSGAGIMATGNYPGKARNGNELREDFAKATSLIPGKHRINLHSIYAETGHKKVERNELQPEHFSRWIDWAKTKGLGIDFNPTFFSHPKAASGFTLASRDPGIRRFWVEHAIACRKIAQHIGSELESPCINNIWIPDGYKDIPVDRLGPRERLKKSLDEVLSEKLESAGVLDALESKLFGIGSESYVVGSHEFYLAYAVSKQILPCLDAGHFHPTEVISDKLSSILLFMPQVLLHVSRGVRWDSDHVVILSEEIRAIAQEIVRGGFLERVHIGLDFFDASINRIAAWVIGSRCMLKALLIALLEPLDKLRDCENECNLTARLAMLEQLKTMPFGAVWDYYCMSMDVPVESAWLGEVMSYERQVLTKR